MNNPILTKILHFIQWVVAGFIALISLVPFSHGRTGIISGVILLAGAFLISPLPNKISVFNSIPKRKGMIQVVGCFALFIIGIAIYPSKSDNNDTIDRSIPEIVETEATETKLVTTTNSASTTSIIETTTKLETSNNTTTVFEPEKLTTTSEITSTSTTVSTSKTKTKTKPKPSTTTTSKPKTTTTTTTVSETTTTTTTEQYIVPDKSISYVVNTNTGKFHYTDCSSVKDIQPGNRWDYTGNRDYLISQGYSPCKRCNP